MTPKYIYAMECVLLMNTDICKLYEKRGVSREELREVFRLAKAKAAEEITANGFTLVLEDFSSGVCKLCFGKGKFALSMTEKEAVKAILAAPPKTKVVLTRSYEHPRRHRTTTVGKLRKERNGWWGW